MGGQHCDPEGSICISDDKCCDLWCDKSLPGDHDRGVGWCKKRKSPPPPAEFSPPPAKLSPPPAEFSPPPAEFSPPPAKLSPPPAEFSPPPAEFSPPPAEFSPPPAEFSPPPAEFSPPPAEFFPPPPEVCEGTVVNGEPLVCIAVGNGEQACGATCTADCRARGFQTCARAGNDGPEFCDKNSSPKIACCKCKGVPPPPPAGH